MGDFCFQGATLLMEHCLVVGLPLFKFAQILGKLLESLLIGVGYYVRRVILVKEALQTQKVHPQRLRDKANREDESTAYESELLIMNEMV